MSHPTGFSIHLPDWLSDWIAAHPHPLADDETRMAAAIELSAENIRRATGGPFGALVVTAGEGRLIAAGVNCVMATHCSLAHAEIVALGLAQARLKNWDLADTHLGPLQLVSSCEPCAMCLGAIPWSGVRSLLCGAGKADAERAGFDEGDRPADWTDLLARRGIAVHTGILRERAAAVLTAYAASEAPIYNPG